MSDLRKVQTFTLAPYRNKRLVGRRFTARGTAHQVRTDAARLLGWLGASRVTVRLDNGRYLPPVVQALPVGLESPETAERPQPGLLC